MMMVVMMVMTELHGNLSDLRPRRFIAFGVIGL
jgi:hypothetical protein